MKVRLKSVCGCASLVLVSHCQSWLVDHGCLLLFCCWSLGIRHLQAARHSNSLTDCPPLQQHKMITCNSDFSVILVSCVDPPYVCPVYYWCVVAIQVALTTLCPHDSLLTYASANYYATAVCYIKRMSLIQWQMQLFISRYGIKLVFFNVSHDTGASSS